MKNLILSIALCSISILSFAQQYPDRHSTSYTDAWLSCAVSANPNSDRGDSHWVHYDLGSTYVLDEVILWNYNDPNNLNNGVQDIAIDVSTDGITWTEAATATVAISEGSAFYIGEDLLSLGAVSASHLLITVLSNHGGTCSGFSELKITTAAILPIELTKFDAQCVETNDGVELAWRTESEVGNDYFTIQRSTNAIDWIDVMDVAAKGSNGSGADYYELEKNISGALYYRLVNTDIDGQRQFFDVASVDCSESGPMTMTVANPFSETLSFTYNPNEVGETTITVESVDGQQVYKSTMYNNSIDQQSILIPSSDWTVGTYVINSLG